MAADISPADIPVWTTSSLSTTHEKRAQRGPPFYVFTCFCIC
jgi:hypothetical protein